jgi:hypothetical protein
MSKAIYNGSTLLGIQRSMADLFIAISALTNAQKTAIWTDLSSGSPAKYLLSEGAAEAGIAALDWAIKDSGATGASLTNARLRIAAMYAYDNPLYLVNPSFDATINIAAYTAAVVS